MQFKVSAFSIDHIVVIVDRLTAPRNQIKIQ